MLTDWMLRLRSVFKRNVVDGELDEELAFHLEQQIASYVSRGMPHDEAVRHARLEFGGLSQIQDEHRDARGTSLLENLWRDVRYGVRQLHRSPAFALTALLCLALGIGATTAVYSLVDAILLRPLPFHDSDRLVTIVEHVPPPAAGRPPMRRGLTYQEFLVWRTKSRTLSSATAIAGAGQQLVRARNGAVGLWGGTAAPDTFTMLGVSAHLGRTLLPGDEDSSVVVLGYEAWQRHFNADPAIVGTSLEFRTGSLMGPTPARLLTVIGVLPRGFALTGPVDFYIPLRRNYPFPVTTLAKLAPGVSLAAASEEANIMGAAMRPPWPADAPRLTVPRFQIEGLKQQSVGHLRPAFRVLLASVVVVLLIVCANVANLLLTRGTARRRELAVRVAIGASRARIIQQIMTECLVLAAAGGALGALLGAGGIMLVKRLAAIDAPGIFRFSFGDNILPRVHEVGIDMTVLGIASAVAALTTVLCGVVPALHLSRTTQVSAMGAKGSNSDRSDSRIRAALTVAQLTMATVLLVSAGLLTHSFIKLSAVNNGYDPTNVLAFNLLFPNEYPVARKADTIEAVLTRLRALPGVIAAGFSRHGILIGEELFIGTFVPPGQALEEMRALRNRVRSVSHGYLTAMGVPILDGREFAASDGPAAPPVIVMNRSAARQYFGSVQAVGQVVNWHFRTGPPQPVRVVGVLEDIRQESPTDEVFPEVFVDYRQFLALLDRLGQPQRQNELAIGFLSFGVRTTRDPAGAVPVVRDLVNAVDPNIGIDGILPMTSLVANAVARQRFYAVMLGTFAGIAGVLAVIGVYGVLAYSVVQRTQEIGVRLSLGAPRAQVLALVFRKGLALTTIGITLGLVGAVAVAGLLRGMLFGITPLDAGTLLTVSGVFAIVAMMACYVPAYRATRIDPIVALRNE